MTERTIPSSVRAGLESPESPDAIIWFLTITHQHLTDPIRVVSDVFDYVLEGHTYTGIVFDAMAVSDGDGAPSGRLIVPNVDRRIGKALKDARGSARVSAVARSTADFDLSEDPRTALGTPDTIYAFEQFHLTNVETDPSMIVGRLGLIDYAQEPWPWVRATADRFPGLFR